MKTLLVVLAYATLATSSPSRDKRSWHAHTHAQAYPAPVTVHTVVRPSNTLPVIEYPESTQIDTVSKTVYSVSVPITHTVHLEQPAHSRQVIYHNPPAIPTYTASVPAYTAPEYTAPVYTAPAYTAPRVYTQVYSPTVYTPKLHRRILKIKPYDPWC